MGLVVPAVLPSSRKDLEETIELLSRVHSVNRVQIDVIDGRFATPPSWPYNAAQELRRMVERGTLLPYLDRIAYEIDLMCFDAESAVGDWIALGASRLTFHVESSTDFPRLLTAVRKRCSTGVGFAPGLISYGAALNIGSDLALVEPCLGEIEYVQLMGISQIGRQGQPFDERVFEKVRIFHNHHPHIPLQVDGGVSLERAQKLITLGVSNLVVGSALLRAPDPALAVAEFENLQSPFGI